MMDNVDIKYMQRCLQLAAYGINQVAPNPMVGAVIVHNGEIIGEGYHQRYGDSHAEPNAIKSVEKLELLKLSTLYVNLEPCSHYGQTPPCADLIVRTGIPRVVIGTLDPNPKVAGRGVEILRKSGVEVVVGVASDDCRTLNKRFFIFQEQKRPFVLLKWAQTCDGFIDRKRSTSSISPLCISNELTRQFTHKMRSENQAILVGSNTVLLDNPSLTVRFWSGKSPVRIAIDRNGVIPDSYNIKNGFVKTIIFTEKPGSDVPKLSYLPIPEKENFVPDLLNSLFELNIHSVLVEGGAMLLNCFITSGIWDEASVEISTQIIDDGVLAPVLSVQPFSMHLLDAHKIVCYQNSIKPQSSHS